MPKGWAGNSLYCAYGKSAPDHSFLCSQDDRDEVRLADLQEADQEINALGFRYYTLEPRTIPYTSPNVTTHPASAKAKEAADQLNEAYQEVAGMHQTIKAKLDKFKEQVGQPAYSDLAACFASLKTLSGSAKVKLFCKDGTEDPIMLEGGSEEFQEALKVYNEMLEICREFLANTNVYLERINERIAALKQLAVMQQILDICSAFEEQAPSNINIFATEIRSLLLDTKSSAKQKLVIEVVT